MSASNLATDGDVEVLGHLWANVVGVELLVEDHDLPELNTAEVVPGWWG